MRRGTREWPLIGFTLLSQTAAGAFWSLAAAETAFDRRLLEGRALLVIIAIGGAGTLLSLFHLGRPARAVNALANLRSSWISREILSDLVFLGSCAALWILEAAGSGGTDLTRTTLIVLGAAAGFALIFSMARIYMLRTVPVWRGPHTSISFFLSAVWLGPLLASALTSSSDEAGSAARMTFAVIALAASGLVLVAAALFTPSVGLLAKTEATLLAYPPGKIMGFSALRAAAALASAGCLIIFLIDGGEGASAPALLIAAGLAALAAEVTGRSLFYAMYSRIGV